MDPDYQRCMGMTYPQLLKFVTYEPLCAPILSYKKQIWNIINDDIETVPESLAKYLTSHQYGEIFPYIVSQAIVDYYALLFSLDELYGYFDVVKDKFDSNINNQELLKIVNRYIGNKTIINDEEYMYYKFYKFMTEDEYRSMITEISRKLKTQNYKYVSDTLFQLFDKIVSDNIIQPITPVRVPRDFDIVAEKSNYEDLYGYW